MKYKTKQLIDGIIFIGIGLQFIVLLWMSKIDVITTYRRSIDCSTNDTWRSLPSLLSDDYGISIGFQNYSAAIVTFAFAAWGILTIRNKILDGFLFIVLAVYSLGLWVFSRLIVTDTEITVGGEYGVNECSSVSLQKEIENFFGLSVEAQTILLTILAIFFCLWGIRIIKKIIEPAV